MRYAVEASAKYAAKLALKEWYKRCFSNADSAICELQIESNLKIVLDMWLSGAQRPVVVMLDYKQKACGGLTYRQLHFQIRMALELEAKVSMRLRRYRPWCSYMLKKMPIPESSALPANDAQCTRLLGTTLWCWTYCT